MEPRSFKRGNINAFVHCERWRSTLQWSHVLSNVETSEISSRAESVIVMLQWSHVLSNVETGGGSDRTNYHLTGFNGATFFQTWKRIDAGQFEIKHRRFNGATFFQTWKLALATG